MSALHQDRRPLFAAFVCICSSLILSFFITNTACALGISPSTIIVDGLRNGNSVTKIMSVSRGNASEEMYVNITLSGEASKYISIESGHIRIPKGTQEILVPFTIAPKSLPNGTYEAQVSVMSAGPQKGIDPMTPSQNSVSLVIGIIGKIAFTVTDQTLEQFKIWQVVFDDTEEGEPIRLYYNLENTGNVDIRPDEIRIKLTDKTDITNVFEKTIGAQSLSFVGPKQRATQLVEVPHALRNGVYNVEIQFYLNNTLVGNLNNDLQIMIFPEGALNKVAEFTSFVANGISFPVGSLIKFDAGVANKGDLLVKPTLYIEIIKDGTTLDLLRSNSQDMRKKEESVVTLTYRPQEPGNYVARAYFEYGIKRTEVKEVLFTVQPNASAVVNASPYVIGSVALVVAILFTLIIIILFRKIKRRKQAAVYPSVQPIMNEQNVVAKIEGSPDDIMNNQNNQGGLTK